MKRRYGSWSGVVAAVLLATSSLTIPAEEDTPKIDGSLRIVFVDTEGGAATLIVTPAGESLLIDPGYPGNRDAERIAAAAKDLGLEQIDLFLSTHWHSDHVGGLPDLVKRIPVRRFFDRGLPETVPRDADAGQLAAYRRLSGGKSTTLRPGDAIPLKASGDGPHPRIRVVAASGRVLGEPEDAPRIRPCSKEGHEPRKEDTSENALSVALVLELGDFRLFAGGDLTWNVEHKLACPENIPGQVDVYQVDHHGFDFSNHPALLEALDPRVAILLNGPRKGGDPATIDRLRALPRLEDIFAMHRNLEADVKGAPPESHTVSTTDSESCKGGTIVLTVAPDGKTYTVEVPSRGTRREYACAR